MKKLLKITGIVFLVIILLLILIPILFKGQIIETVKTEIDKNVNAKVEFKDVSFGLITSFPYFKLSIEDLSVAGIGDFKGDTLVKFKSLVVKLNLMSVIQMENIEIRSIILDNPVINAKVLKNGKANWDIAKPDTAPPAKVDTLESKPTKFKLSLKQFDINNAYIKYDDQTMNMKTSMDNFNFALAGDLSDELTTLNITSQTDVVNFVFGGIKYLNKAKVAFKIDVDADMNKSEYILKENEFSINDISLGWNGKVAMPDSNIKMDLTFKTNKADFKSLLSLVPAIYMKGFETVKTAGSLKLEGYLKGTYNGKVMPNAGLTLLVANAMFKYPDLPKSVEKINIDVKLFYDGVQMDNSTVDINKFHLEVAQNPFDLVMNIKTPISDPAVNAKFKGKLDLNSIRDVVPLDSVTLKGVLETDLDMMGQMSMITKQEYDKFKADGSISLTNFQYKNKDFPQGVDIRQTTLNFSPKEVDLVSFDATIGKSDMKMNGKLTNFIPYFLKGETIHGKLDFSSNLLDLNEFLAGDEEPKAAEKTPDTAQLTLVEIPKNIDFALSSKIGQINYDKLVINNTLGVITIKEGKVVLDKLKMNMLEGSMIMSGEYNTNDITKPFVDFDFDITDFDIPSSFVAFNTVKKLAPVASSAKGKFSLGMSFKSFLDPHMNPVLNTLVGDGKFSSKSVEIMNSKMFGKVADALKKDDLRNIKLENVAFTFKIKDGRIYLDPFDTKFGNSKLNITGDQGIDQTMNYVMGMSIPRGELGGAANQVINNMVSQINAKGVNVQMSDIIKVNVVVGGTVKDPKITLSLKDSDGKGVKEQVKEQVKAVVDEKKKEVKAAASQKAQELIANAQKEADNIKSTAAKAAEVVRLEANNNATNVENQAKGKPGFVKDVAKKSADKIRKEGDAKANKIIVEANQKADAIMQKARAEADKLK